MGFPKKGNCLYNKRHTMYGMTYMCKAFISGKSCDKCAIPFNRILDRDSGWIVVPAYYHCEICDTFSCFNCTKTANQNSIMNWGWDDASISEYPRFSWELPYLPMSAYEKKPFNINKLKLNDLINRCDSNTLKKCMKEAIKLFGGYKAMLFYLINNMNTNQLQLMQGKVMKQYTKYNTSHSTSNINPFETLPKVLMTYHICKYLNQDDINQFKLTSRNIAIICYERKNKKMSLNKLDIFERNYVCVEMKTNKDWIKQSIQKHYDNALNKNEACFFKYEIETIFDVIDMNKWKVNVTSGLIALKQQVSKLFGNFIAPKYIEFTHPINGMILREKDAIHLNSNVSRTSLNGHIVWKRNDKISENDILYTVNIF
eukprot:53882_1